MNLKEAKRLDAQRRGYNLALDRAENASREFTKVAHDIDIHPTEKLRDTYNKKLDAMRRAMKALDDFPDFDVVEVVDDE